MKGFYQVLSRNNSYDGHVYRLVLVYNKKAEVKQVYHCKSSMPHIVGTLDKQGYTRICPYHLAPALFNTVKKDWEIRGLLKHEN